MKDIKKRFWSVPAYLDYVQRPINADIIRDAEETLKVKLPQTYLDLLSFQNGGYTNWTLRDVPHSQIWGIGDKFPTILGSTLKDRLEDVNHEKWCENPKGLIPFDGDGHWYLCFDYRRGGPETQPQISFIDAECETQRLIANSFDEFLNVLEPSLSDHGVIVVSGCTLKELLKALKKQLRVKFSGPDDWAHGYPVWKARYPKSDEPEWIWVNQNTVPKGFRRGRKGKVKPMQETALMLSEFSETDIIVTATSEISEVVLQALGESKISHRVINKLKHNPP